MICINFLRCKGSIPIFDKLNLILDDDGDDDVIDDDEDDCDCGGSCCCCNYTVILNH